MSTLSIQAVIFDFDGVIADTEWLHFRAFSGVLAEEGIRVTEDDHTQRFIGINDWNGFRKAFGEVDKPLDEIALRDLVERKNRRYLARLDEVKPLPGVESLIETLAARVPLAIASGSHDDEILATLRRLSLAERFPIVVSADSITCSKPAPDIYLETVARLSAALPEAVEAPRCVAIEDSVLGVQSAKAAGLQCVAITQSFPAARLRHADRIIDCFAELDAETPDRWFEA